MSSGSTGVADYDSAMHESFLVHDRLRHLKRASLLCLVAIALYVFIDFGVPHNGGTWLGYALGVISMLLILWLTWFGWKKRRVPAGSWKLKGWLSAHIYYGLALITLGALHAGFQFAWNLHTLAYGLMVFVILTGVYGIYAYARYPIVISELKGGLSNAEIMRRIEESDDRAEAVAMDLDERYVQIVRRARSETRVIGGLRSRLSGRVKDCATDQAIADVSRLMSADGGDHSVAAEQLRVALSHKAQLLARMRKLTALKSRMEFWLYGHAPFAFLLIAALTAHVVSVFFYW